MIAGFLWGAILCAIGAIACGVLALTSQRTVRRDEWGDRQRHAQAEMAELARLAKAYDLPMPLEPFRQVGKWTVYPTHGEGTKAMGRRMIRGSR